MINFSNFYYSPSYSMHYIHENTIYKYLILYNLEKYSPYDSEMLLYYDFFVCCLTCNKIYKVF